MTTFGSKHIRLTFLILLVLFAVFLASSWYMQTDGFTSDGTLLQLQTSHVPTAEDVRRARRERRRIHRDLVDLTGSN